MDHDLIQQLFSKYYNDVLLYAMSLAKDVSEAEDLASEAFYRALRTADGEIVNFKAWILAVCRNLYFNHRRKRARLTELSDEIADKRDCVLDKIMQDDNYRALYRAIGLLSDNLKEIIVLFYFEDMKVQTIAQIVQKSENNVKVMLFRGREQLRTILEK